MEAIQIQGLTKRYTEKVALDNISLTIPDGSIYGLLGPNGAGKTTLIRIINQIIKADEGEITLFGEKLMPHHVSWIGYLPEERGLYKKMKVGEQLLFLARLKGLARSEARDKIVHWFDKFEITDWLGKKVQDLSKGMAQKVQFIGTVMHEPRLIILDEPFSGFDPVNVQLVAEHILALREKGSTIIFSTHRMETVESMCDHVAFINHAKVILEGARDAVKAKFLTNHYVVKHQGDLVLPAGYTLKQAPIVSEGFSESVIQAPATAQANQVVKDLIGQTELFGFTEKLPTMAEIFMALVKGDTQVEAVPENA